MPKSISMVTSKVASAITRERRFDLAVFAAALGTYAITLAPGAMWGDSAKYVIHSATWHLSVDGGYHALYSLIAAFFVRIVPGDDPALALNLLSALIGAGSVVLLRGLLRAEGVRNWIASTFALAFAFSHAQWHLSVIAESYTLSLFGVLLVARIARPLFARSARDESRETVAGVFRSTPPSNTISIRHIFWLGLTSGLVVSNFLLMIAYFGLMVILLALFRRETMAPAPIRSVLALFGGFLLGTALIWGPWIYTVSRGMLTAAEATSMALNGRYASTFFWQAPAQALRGLTLLGGLTLYQFPSPLLLFAIPGVITLARRQPTWFLWTFGMAVGTALFCSTYMVQRAVFVMLPVFSLVALFAAVGFDHLWTRLQEARVERASRPSRRRNGRRVCLACAAIAAVAPIPVYPMFVSGLALAEVDPVPGRDLPYRDNARYFLLPAKGQDNGPRELAEEVITLAGGGCVVADFTPFTVLSYYVSRGREDVEVRTSEGVKGESLCALLADTVDVGRPLYFVDDEPEAYPIDELPDDYALVSVGHLYQVVLADSLEAHGRDGVPRDENEGETSSEIPPSSRR